MRELDRSPLGLEWFTEIVYQCQLLLYVCKRSEESAA